MEFSHREKHGPFATTELNYFPFILESEESYIIPIGNLLSPTPLVDPASVASG